MTSTSSSGYPATDYYLSTLVKSEEYKDCQQTVTKKSFEVFICGIIDDLQPSSELYAALFVDLITRNAPYMGKCDINVSLEICNPYSKRFFIDLGSAENIGLDFLKEYKGQLGYITVRV